MPIEVTCDGCQKRLRVPDKVAGKRIRCPNCSGVVAVPATETESASAESNPTPTATREPSPSNTNKLPDLWYLKTEEGDDYGPVPKSELDGWVEEGRVTADSQLLQEGADQWQWASDVYPHLETPAQPTPPAAAPPAAVPPVRQTSKSGTGSKGIAIDVGSTSKPATSTSSNIGVASEPSADKDPFAFAAADASASSRIGGGTRRKAVRKGGRKSSISRRKRGPSGHKSGAVTIVAVLNFIYSVMLVVCGGVMLLAGGLIATISGAASQSDHPQAGQAATLGGVVGVMAIGIGALSWLSAALLVFAGVGVIKRASWGRVLTLVCAGIISILALFNIYIIVQGNVFAGVIGLVMNCGYAAYAFAILLNRRYAEEFG